MASMRTISLSYPEMKNVQSTKSMIKLKKKYLKFNLWCGGGGERNETKFEFLMNMTGSIEFRFSHKLY